MDEIAPPKFSTTNDLIEQLERAVFGRNTSDATSKLLRLLDAMARVRSSEGLMPPPCTPEQRRAAYTRVAAMISALMCSPDFRINLEQVADLCSKKPILESIFELSGYEGPFHLLAYHGTRLADGSLQFRPNQVFLLALFYSLDNLPAELLAGVLKLPANQLLPLMTGWFTAPFVHSPEGEKNRARLIENSSLAEAASPTPPVITSMTAAWMHCSYSDHPGKHALKKSLNVVWHRLGLLGGVKSRVNPRRIVNRPKLLICAERMLASHAMHRSYAACLRQLRKKFYVACVVVASQQSPKTHEMFDEVILLEPGSELSKIAAKIVRFAPDIVYYPSLGMSDWTQVSCNFRFAPIQLLTLGHPAPPMSEMMDYALVQIGHGEAATGFGRKVIERKAWGQFVPNTSKELLRGDRLVHKDGRLHIAVNSSLMKLSPRFLSLCMRLETEAQRMLHFHFFASATGVVFDRMLQVLARRFHHFTLEPHLRYEGFLHRLSGCDLALSAFPFGNTNSTVDTCLMGVPCVAYFANEVLSIGDRDVMRIAGLPDWLVTESDEQYFRVAMNMIHDDAARKAVADRLKATDVWARFFETESPEDATEFVDAMDWIYRNHEALQASSRHVIKVGEPLAV